MAAYRISGFLRFARNDVDRVSQNRSSARRPIAHGKPAPQSPARPTLPRPPHPAPTFVTMAKAPHRNGMAESIKLFLPNGESKYFAKQGCAAL
jgi:hypothetical protein